MPRSSFSSFRLFVTALLGLLTATSFAGWYKVEYIQSGQSHQVGPMGVPSDHDYTDTSDGGRAGAGFSQDYPNSLAGRPGAALCDATITAKFTWVPSGDEPPPACVVLRQVAGAAWGGDSGSCSDGLGGTPTSDSEGGSSSKTIVEVVASPGDEFFRTCKPTAEAYVVTPATNATQAASASVYYRAEAYAVYVNLLNTNDGTHTIIGQEIIGQLDYSFSRYGTDGIHQHLLQFSNHSWTLSGQTFDRFYLSPYKDEGYAIPVPAAELLTQNPSWIWRDRGTGNVSVTANVAIDGVAATGQATGSHAYDIAIPDFDITAAPEDVHYIMSGTQVLGAQTGLLSAGVMGIKFNFMIDAPAIYGGQGCLCQLMKWKATVNGNEELNHTAWKLDNLFPFLNQTFFADGRVWMLPDAPAYQHTEEVTSMNLDLKFKMYMLYQPSGPGDWAPLTYLDWAALCDFQRDSSGAYPAESSIGSITVSGRNDTNTHPEWHSKFVNTSTGPPPGGGSTGGSGGTPPRR